MSVILLKFLKSMIKYRIYPSEPFERTGERSFPLDLSSNGLDACAQQFDLPRKLLLDNTMLEAGACRLERSVLKV